MARIIVDVSELRSKDAQKRKDLAEFLQAKLSVNVTHQENLITIDDVPSKAYPRLLIRKFLHRSGLKERFRPISNGEKIIVKRRKEQREE